ncbi:MAG: trypsin-like peptidase domain-containing protein [Clostridiales bacterium]|nr:trypsin-like peptidase domain-containing protein [Clostridiales bacterium]
MNKSFQKTIWLTMILFFGFLGFASIKVYGKEVDKISETKSGILEIKAGFTDKNGRFHMLKRSSGCLISNGSGYTYVVTTYHSVNISNKEKSAYCKEKEIETDVKELTDSIRVMIKGDVDVEAVVMTESQAQDYSILSVDSVINEKNALKLGSSGSLKTGDPVYVLGFPDEVPGNAVQYSEADVEIHAGYIQDASSKRKDAVCIQHSGVVTPGNSGGALVDTDGYFVGLNNAAYTNEEIRAYYSLAVDEIKEILDNYGIVYGSKEKELALQNLKTLLSKCRELEESGDYKGESLVTLQQNIQAVEGAMKESELTVDGIQEKVSLLEKSRSNLEKKMPLTRKVVYILAVCCILLFAKLMHILIVRWKDNRSPRKQKGQAAVSEVGNEKKQEKEYLTDTGQQNNIRQKKSGKENIQIEHVDEESTTLLFQSEDEDEDERTELQNPLNDNFSRNAKKARLEQERTRKIIEISKPEFFIGKKPELVDYAILDNKVISRLHAVILWEDGLYTIQDKESVNGTFVNGKKIDSEGVALKNADEITLANEIFIFRISQ